MYNSIWLLILRQKLTTSFALLQDWLIITANLPLLTLLLLRYPDTLSDRLNVFREHLSRRNTLSCGLTRFSIENWRQILAQRNSWQIVITTNLLLLALLFLFCSLPQKSRLYVEDTLILNDNLSLLFSFKKVLFGVTGCLCHLLGGTLLFLNGRLCEVDFQGRRSYTTSNQIFVLQCLHSILLLLLFLLLARKESMTADLLNYFNHFNSWLRLQSLQSSLISPGTISVNVAHSELLNR